MTRLTPMLAISSMAFPAMFSSTVVRKRFRLPFSRSTCFQRSRNVVFALRIRPLSEPGSPTAEKDPTFLMAPVEIAATFRLFDIDRTALENLLHRFFAPARLEITIPDRFGNPVRPREWFFVPLPAIQQAIEKIQERSLHRYEYRPEQAALMRRA